MNPPDLVQACLEARRLTALSECLQDFMEDRKAGPRVGYGGVVDPDSDQLLSLISGIFGSGGRIVELMKTQISQMGTQTPLPVLDDHIALATKEMLTAVAEVSQVCDQLRHSPFAREYALPDFALLARQSAELKQMFQRAYPMPGPGTRESI